jgi:hypothetical protein
MVCSLAIRYNLEKTIPLAIAGKHEHAAIIANRHTSSKFHPSTLPNLIKYTSQ